jgi:hypothetical protein
MGYPTLREENRRQEILDLIDAGKIPHWVEMEKHPEKSLNGHMCEFSWDPVVTRYSSNAGLMGQIAASVKVGLRFRSAPNMPC